MYCAMYYYWKKWTFEESCWMPFVLDGCDLALLVPSSCTYIISKERTFQLIQLPKLLFQWTNAYNHGYPYYFMRTSQTHTWVSRLLPRYWSTNSYTVPQCLKWVLGDGDIVLEKNTSIPCCHLLKTHGVCVRRRFSVCQTCYDRGVLVGSIESASIA